MPGYKTTRDQAEFKEDLSHVLMCKDCKTKLVHWNVDLMKPIRDADSGPSDCGVVVGERIIDNRSEWRTFSNDDQGGDDPSRVGDGPNQLIDGDQLQTSIAFEGGKGARNLSHLQNKITQDKGSKALLESYKIIQTFVDRMNAGSTVANAAKHIFKMVEDNKALKGKSQDAIIAGCIFIACRQSGVPRTFRELHSETKVTKKEIGRVFKQLENFLQKIGGEEQVVKASALTQMAYDKKGSTNAVELCARFVSKLHFNDRMPIEIIAKNLAKSSESLSDLAGRSPLSVCAACIYMASHLKGEPRSSKKIAAITGVSDGTVKTAYRFLYQAREQLINLEWFPVEGAKVIEKLPAN